MLTKEHAKLKLWWFRNFGKVMISWYVQLKILDKFKIIKDLKQNERFITKRVSGKQDGRYE